MEFNVDANADIWMEVEGEFKELRFEGITGTLQVKRVDFPYAIQGTGSLTIPWIQNKQHAFLTKQDDDLYRSNPKRMITPISGLATAQIPPVTVVLET